MLDGEHATMTSRCLRAFSFSLLGGCEAAGTYHAEDPWPWLNCRFEVVPFQNRPIIRASLPTSNAAQTDNKQGRTRHILYGNYAIVLMMTGVWWDDAKMDLALSFPAKLRVKSGAFRSKKPGSSGLGQTPRGANRTGQGKNYGIHPH